jgi:7,8-dihydropterin-6-yl-methyl-4-(beta-D-ribofuranosyl)aminobenzene 5'-phosphate synthase
MHLLSRDPQRIKRTGEYLHELHLLALHACHCTSLASKIILAGYCQIVETGVGLKLEW